MARSSEGWVTRVLLLSLLGISTVSANLRLEVTADTRRAIDLGTFAFSDSGNFLLQIQNFFIDPTVMDKDPNFDSNGEIGFVLDPVISAQGARIEKSNANTDGVQKHLCFIDDPEIKPKNLNYRHKFPINVKENSNNKDFSSRIQLHHLYALFFYNCKGFASNGTTLTPVPVSFTATATMYNLDATGNKNFLDYGLTSTPMWYLVFGLVFTALAVKWVDTMRLNPKFVHRVHQAMLVVVVLKALSLLSEAAMLWHYAYTGEGSIWDVFYYVILGLKGTMLFSVLLLLGSGWSIVKAFLSDNDRKILAILVPAQVLIDVALAVIHESNEGRKGWSTWVMVLNLVDLLCCCAVLLPIVWSMKHLHTSGSSSAAGDEKAALTLGRLRQFRSFYMIVVAYIYATRVFVVMVEGCTPYSHLWAPKVLRELISVVFYVYYGMKFLPTKDGVYARLDQEDAEMKDLQSRSEVDLEEP